MDPLSIYFVAVLKQSDYKHTLKSKFSIINHEDSGILTKLFVV